MMPSVGSRAFDELKDASVKVGRRACGPAPAVRHPVMAQCFIVRTG
jgi:hypothetical protein